MIGPRIPPWIRLSLVVGLLVSCAAGPHIERRPADAIDRPLVLPEDVREWNLSILGVIADGKLFPVGLVIPSNRWVVGLDDGVDLRLSPLIVPVIPALSFSTGVGIEVAREGPHELAVVPFLGALIANVDDADSSDSNLGVALSPGVTIAHRLRLAESWALDSAAHVVFAMAVTPQFAAGISGGAGTAAHWQYTRWGYAVITAGAGLGKSLEGELGENWRSEVATSALLGFTIGRRYDIGLRSTVGVPLSNDSSVMVHFHLVSSLAW